MRRVSLSISRGYTTAVAEPVRARDVPVDSFRTIESNPVNHDHKHLNRYYKMSDDMRKKLFLHGGMPKNLLAQFDTFVENCILIRQPTLEIISYLKTTDYSKPVNRYVLCILFFLLQNNHHLVFN